MDLVGGRGLPRQLRFENFVCQNERIWTLGGGGGCAPVSVNVDPPMHHIPHAHISPSEICAPKLMYKYAKNVFDGTCIVYNPPELKNRRNMYTFQLKYVVWQLTLQVMVINIVEI